MKFIRKALLPVAVAAGVLGFMGALGPSAVTVSADPGDVISVEGPTHIQVGSPADYTVTVEGSGNTDVDPATIDVDLNDQTGDSDITSVNGDDRPETDFLDNVPLRYTDNVVGDSTDDLVADLAGDIYDFLNQGVEDGEVCAPQPIGCEAPSPLDDSGTDDFGSNGFNDDDIDCGYVSVIIGDNQCVVPTSVLHAVADQIAASMIAAPVGSCLDEYSGDADNIALDADSTEFVSWQIEDFIEDNGGDICVSDNGTDLTLTVDVTCDVPGIFDLSFSTDDSAKSIEVTCGDDVTTAEIFSNPSSVETNPSVANVAHSLVWVVLEGRDGEPAAPGTKVTFLTDRCAIESNAVDSEEEFEGAESLFRANNALNPSTAQAIEASTYAATTAPDGASRQQEEVTSFTVTANSGDPIQRTVAAVVLHCDPIHAPNVTPGPAVVTAIVDRGSVNNGLVNDNDDLVVKTTVTVVGPPAANGVTVTAAPATVACGEKATITVDVKDAIGQPVSDHTLVEAVTNAGGVLAGTGAVAGQAGLVTPVSSTVAETFGGKATFYLLTSTANVGKYEVVVTTGGGGGITGQLDNGGVSTNLLGGLFTTAPISVQVTVECTVPQAAAPTAPAPDTSGPATGQGIRPPSTGDAGLVSTDSNTWVFGAAVAVVAALAVAGLSVKLVREE